MQFFFFHQTLMKLPCTPTETPNKPAKPFPQGTSSGLGLWLCQERQEFCVSEDHRPPTSTTNTTNGTQTRRSTALTNVLSVHCKLGTSIQWQTICHHLQSSGVSRIFQIKIEIAHQNPASFPILSATLRGDGHELKEVATPARTHGERKRQLFLFSEVRTKLTHVRQSTTWPTHALRPDLQNSRSTSCDCGTCPSAPCPELQEGCCKCLCQNTRQNGVPSQSPCLLHSLWTNVSSGCMRAFFRYAWARATPSGSAAPFWGSLLPWNGGHQCRVDSKL